MTDADLRFPSPWKLSLTFTSEGHERELVFEGTGGEDLIRTGTVLQSESYEFLRLALLSLLKQKELDNSRVN